MGWYCRMNT
jgi:hypothetical protein